MKRKKGFTLIEVMAVVAVLAILLAILVPTVTSHIENAKLVKASADIRTIQGSVIAFLISIGYWPPGYSIDPPLLPVQLRLMYGPGKVPAFDSTVPDSQFWLSDTNGWGTPLTDTMQNQLISNTPEGGTPYPTDETIPLPEYWWQGPYLTQLTADPWGNQYCCVINVGDKNMCGVISAGPDGMISTSAIQTETDVVVGGDDIFVQIK